MERTRFRVRRNVEGEGVVWARKWFCFERVLPMEGGVRFEFVLKRTFVFKFLFFNGLRRILQRDTPHGAIPRGREGWLEGRERQREGSCVRRVRKGFGSGQGSKWKRAIGSSGRGV